MKNDFAEAIDNIEKELLALKTASDYASVRSAHSAQVDVRTGLYRITYENTSDPIFSLAFAPAVADNYNIAYLRTPSGNTQIVEINTDDMVYPSNTHTARLTIVSNVPVTSITRIS